MVESVQQFLDDIPFLRFLPDAARTEIQERFQHQHFTFGDIIVREGEGADSFFLIVAGNARVLSTSEDGTDIPVNTLHVGDFFGEMGLLTAGVRTKTVRASGNVDVVSLGQADFKAIISRYPDSREYIELQVKHRNLQNFLRQYSFLGSASSAVVQAILRALTPVEVCAGARIIQEGDSSGPMYIIEDGRCRVFRNVAGSEVNLAYLRQGDFFGELSLLQQTRRGASVQAASNCRLLSLEPGAFHALIGTYPELEILIQRRISTYNSGSGPDRIPLDFAQLLKKTDSDTVHELSESDPRVIQSSTAADNSVPAPHANGATAKRRKIKRRRHVPFVQQIDEADCGAAAFAMICRYFGCNISLPYVRELTCTGIDGTTLRDLARAGEEIGLHTQSVKMSARNLDQISMPAVIHWQNDHWVVLIARKGDKLRIADPARQIHWISREAFEQNWTGYAILFDTPDDLIAVPETRGLVAWILPFLRPLRKSIAITVFLTVVISLLQLSFPILTQTIVDKVLAQRDPRNLNLFIMALGGSLAGTLLLTIFQRHTLSYAAARLDGMLMNVIIDKMLSLPMSYFINRSQDDIQRRLEGATEIRHFIVQSAVGGLIAGIQLIAYVCLMAVYSLRMTQIFLLLVPIYFGLMFFSAKILKPAFDDIQNNEARYRSLQKDIVKGIQTVKAAGAENFYKENVISDFSKLLKSQSQSKFNIYCYDGTIQTLGFLSTILFLWIGALLVLHDQLTMGGFIAFQMLTAMSYFPIFTLLNMWEELQLSSVLLNRLNDIIECAPEQDYSHHTIPVTTLQGKIEFRNVGFSYGGSRAHQALKGINFTALPGQVIGIVGKSGSGKTTLVKCIAALLEPTEGTMSYDDVEVSKLKLTSLRRFVGLVVKNDHIFSGTVMENIALGDAEPNIDRVVRAAKLANAHSLITNLAHHYDTHISDLDLTLSPADKQNISIARVIYRDPSFFVFDEATDSLDLDNERRVLANLESIRQGRTLIIVTHRLESIRHADRILVMNRGAIVEHGTHDELVSRHGLYFELVNE